ncbi:MAG: hypothetical protein IPK10_19505 [Bacteroidetes bacterium]|nr:hypothetical protein [Bacteroidota bacterium]
MAKSKISRFTFSYFFVVSVIICFSQLELIAQVSPSFASINHPIPNDIFGFNGANT